MAPLRIVSGTSLKSRAANWTRQNKLTTLLSCRALVFRLGSVKLLVSPLLRSSLVLLAHIVNINLHIVLFSLVVPCLRPPDHADQDPEVFGRATPDQTDEIGSQQKQEVLHALRTE